MHLYYYGVWLLTFGVVLANSRFIFRSNETDDIYNPNNYYFSQFHQPSILERFIDNMLALELKPNDDPIPFERRRRPITKGDPREFVG